MADSRQADLFGGDELFPVRRPTPAEARPVDLSLRIKTAMSRALKECPDSAGIVAAKVAEITGRELTTDALYTYTAPSKDHTIDIIRFIAFVRVTGASWLWDELVRDDGLVVMEGAEAKLANYGLLKQERDRIDTKLAEMEAELKADPVVVRSVRRGGRT